MKQKAVQPVQIAPGFKGRSARGELTPCKQHLVGPGIVMKPAKEPVQPAFGFETRSARRKLALEKQSLAGPGTVTQTAINLYSQHLASEPVLHAGN